MYSNIRARNNATRTITRLGRKNRLNLSRKIDTKAIYEFVNPEACIILTMPLDVELVFWFIRQLFYSTLCLDSSLYRCIKVTNVSNKEKHYESYLIQFCLKDLLYVCADTRRKSWRTYQDLGGKSMCQQPGIIISNQMQPSWHSEFWCSCQVMLQMYFSTGLLQFAEDWVWKALPHF